MSINIYHKDYRSVEWEWFLNLPLAGLTVLFETDTLLKASEPFKLEEVGIVLMNKFTETEHVTLAIYIGYIYICISFIHSFKYMKIFLHVFPVIFRSHKV